MAASDESPAQEAIFAAEAMVDLGPYMLLADAELNIFSIFDDLKYDRSDADMMSPPMRRHAVQTLDRLGFRQTSGSVMHHKPRDLFCYIPKPQVLGASPFDVTRYTPKRDQDYYVLTPTQTACRLIDTYPCELAVEKIVSLIWKQPINLYRLLDYLEKKPAHEAIRPALGFFKSEQRKAVQSEPLCLRRALR